MISSRKRKHDSISNPFIGVFTRRKLHSYSHPNRSGRSRLDSTSTVHRLKSPTRSRRKICREDSSDRMEMAHHIVKDLRSRRIFSPSLITSQCLFQEGSKIGTYCDVSVLPKVEGEGSMALTNTFLDNSKRVDYTDLDLVLSDSTASYANVERGRSGEESENPRSDGDHLDDQSNASVVQISDGDLSKVDGCLVKCNVLADIQMVEFSGKTTEDVEFNHMSERSGRCNSVISPSAKRKIFTDPSSFSYKRLLPFLMSMTDDRSRNGKIQKAKEKLSFSPLVSFTKEASINKQVVEGQEISMRKITKDLCLPSKSLNEPLSRCNGTKKIPPQLLAMANFKTGGMKGYEEFKDKKFSSSPTYLCQEMHDSKSTLRKFPCELPTGEHAVSPSSPESNAIASRGDSNIDLLTDSHNILEEVQKDGCASIEEVNTINDRKPTFALEDHVPFRGINGGFLKGILKRNPRGCRGLCTCLNCSSFRLHAERSFEFSQNQMQDTEEITTVLVKELSNMQCILGKIVQESIDGTAPFDTNKVNSQIKEACSRASMAEEVIKGRIEQMNEDLIAHYRTKRLQRPRVSFVFSEEMDSIQRKNL